MEWLWCWIPRNKYARTGLATLVVFVVVCVTKRSGAAVF